VGVTPRRRIGAAALTLVLLSGGACTGDDGDDRPAPTSTSTTEAASTTSAPEDGTLGGSRYLVYVRPTDDGGDELIRRDLRTGEEREVRSHAGGRYFSEVAVSPTGALAWAETNADGDSVGIEILPTIEDTPVYVQGLHVACPQWREDGALSHTYTQDGITRAALADGETGAYLGNIRYDLPTEQCAALIGADSIVFARPRGEEPYDPAGAEVVRVAIGGGHEEVIGHISGPCWPMYLAGSPDGGRLAATVYCDRAEEGPERWGVYVGTTADDLRPLVAENDPDDDPDTAYQYSSPSWSADGSVLVYTRTGTPDGRRPPQVFSIEVDGGDPVELVSPAYGGSLSGG
jgi:hypothetical protein